MNLTQKRMKISGFTFVRNAVKYDYPVVEAITSVLPLCDEFIVCLGNSDDETEDLISSINSDKIRIVRSVWDDSLRKGGKALAVETDKAFNAIAPDSNWAFYIQADEVVHEKYLPVIRRAMEQYLHNDKVECLVLKYLHFYGSYKYVGNSRRWYRREVRVIRNDKSISAYRDAQGFRREEKKLNGKLIDAYVYHYGWVKNPHYQQKKLQSFVKLWHSDDQAAKHIPQEFNYSETISLALFNNGGGWKMAHPKVMQQRVNSMNWDFKFDAKKNRQPFKERVLNLVEKVTGVRLFEFRNYKLV
jgi:hypothetical protein